jgi:hypothetical protein
VSPVTSAALTDAVSTPAALRPSRALGDPISRNGGEAMTVIKLPARERGPFGDIIPCGRRLPFNGRINVKFDIPDELREKAMKEGIDTEQLANSIMQTILLAAVGRLIEEG